MLGPRGDDPRHHPQTRERAGSAETASSVTRRRHGTVTIARRRPRPSRDGSAHGRKRASEPSPRIFAGSQQPLQNSPTVRSTRAANQQTSPASEPLAIARVGKPPEAVSSHERGRSRVRASRLKRPRRSHDRSAPVGAARCSSGRRPVFRQRGSSRSTSTLTAAACRRPRPVNPLVLKRRGLSSSRDAGSR
jgi:hypothetical protein